MRPSPSLVLTYHRVGSGRDPLQQCVEPGRLVDQVSVLRELADVVPLAELDKPSRSRRVAVTFDDGYADNAAVAAPILRDAAVPATFFIPSRILEDRTEYWWDRLEHAHLDGAPQAATVDVAPAGRRVRIDVRSEAGRLRSLKALNRRLRSLPLTVVEPLVAEIAGQLRASPSAACDAHAVMGATDVASIAAEPLFEIGSHGITHVMLSALPSADQEAELRASRASLERATGRPVTSLAYPFGTVVAFTEETIRLAQESGYQRACSNVAGPGHANRGRYRLPRHMVYDWSRDEFLHNVRRWFDSL